MDAQALMREVVAEQADPAVWPAAALELGLLTPGSTRRRTTTPRHGGPGTSVYTAIDTALTDAVGHANTLATAASTL